VRGLGEEEERFRLRITMGSVATPPRQFYFRRGQVCSRLLCPLTPGSARAAPKDACWVRPPHMRASNDPLSLRARELVKY